MRYKYMLIYRHRVLNTWHIHGLWSHQEKEIKGLAELANAMYPSSEYGYVHVTDESEAS